MKRRGSNPYNGSVSFLSLVEDHGWNGMVTFQCLVGEMECNGFGSPHIFWCDFLSNAYIQYEQL